MWPSGRGSRLSGSSRWPWPGDSREEKARRVALSYRHLVEVLLTTGLKDPQAALAELDAKWLDLQQFWLFADRRPLNVDEWLSASEMAEIVFLPAQVIRMWGVRGHVRVRVLDGLNRYNVGDVVEYEAAQRNRRARKELR